MSRIYSVKGPSGGKLAYLLNCSVYHPNGEDNQYPDWGIDHDRKVNLPIAINYGCKRNVLPTVCVNYDSEDSSDKRLGFSVMEAYGIPCPKQVDPKNYKGPLLGRTDGLSRGEGITKYHKDYNGAAHDFFVELIDGVSEHRVHVWNGTPIIELNKEKGYHSYIHSSKFGARMSLGYIKNKDRMKILDMAVKSIDAMDLHYGAVDIIVDRFNKFYILEVNSAPSLAGIFGYIYARHINHAWNLGVEFDWSIKNNKIERIEKTYE